MLSYAQRDDDIALTFGQVTKRLCSYHRCVDSFVKCEFCGVEYPAGEGTRRIVLRAASGYLVMANPEQTLHRCPSLTREDESTLLQDASWIFDNPESP